MSKLADSPIYAELLITDLKYYVSRAYTANAH